LRRKFRANLLVLSVHLSGFANSAVIWFGHDARLIKGAAMNIVCRLRQVLRSFRSARGGNVVITFALATVPIIGLVGAAVDYSRASSARVALQSALDAAALMLSKDAPNLNEAQLKEKAGQYFNALFNRTEVHDVTVNPVLTRPQTGSFKLDVEASGKIDSSFTRIFGAHETTLSSNAQIQWGIKRLEVALALDNTGSMASSGKMTELKKAVKTLLDTLEKAAKKPEDVKVAIVPFDTTVRLNQTGDTAADWIKFDTPKEKNKWKGCVEDRDQSYDVTDLPPVVGTVASLYPAQDCNGDDTLVKMRELTNDWAALRSTVDAMTPAGNTNVTIGLVWAWHALTANLPFVQGSAPQPDLDKVIILLTDGENTHNRWTGNSESIDARTKLACANAKAANIKIYTVRVINGDVDLLKGCATNPTMYYDVQQASQLNTVFTSIAQNLANLRIAK
jgi:Flp pilus assembly protein TadG